MKTFKIGEAYSTAWSKLAERFWYLSGLAVALFALMALTTGKEVLYTALSYIVFGGFIAMLLRYYDGKKVVFDDLFSIDSRWISFTFTSLIKGMLIFVGLLLFIVPGVYLALRWMFAELLVIDKGMRPMEALKASSEMTKGHMWKLLWFFILSILTILAGTVLLFVGIFPAMIIMTFAMISVYRQLDRK
ncbi:hypothetical protein COB52_03480 [Candidatus Kaiserbacteria bacterium]|nr:MAG: hypothetical protein COB52_03480 [Candidatus Kaiserbacteria bacterium]